MRKFEIKVNGKTYQVEVEEIIDKTTSITKSVSNQSVNNISEKKEVKSKPEAPKPSASVPAGATEVKAPMPGTILDIKVNTGDNIKKGDVLFILEAMKMENEIISPKDGTIASINVTKGASVNSGDILASIQ